MAIVDRATLKSYFQTGDLPTQSNFEDLIDSMCALAEDSTFNDGVKLISAVNPAGNIQIGDGGGDADIIINTPNAQLHLEEGGAIELSGGSSSEIVISVGDTIVELASTLLSITSDATTVSGGDVYVGTGNLLITDGGLDIQTPGKGLAVAEGSNARQGVATLVTGTKVVNTSVVGTNSRISLTAQNSSGTVGSYRVSARTPGTSFTILSSSALDTSVIFWEIFEAG